MQARLNRNKLREAPSEFEPAEREVGRGGLHEKIVAECERRVWACITNRTDKRSTSGLGVCDCIIAADRGRTFYVELKAKGKKQSIAQLGFEATLKKNGHVYHLVFSFEQFLSVVDGIL